MFSLESGGSRIFGEDEQVLFLSGMKTIYCLGMNTPTPPSCCTHGMYQSYFMKRYNVDELNLYIIVHAFEIYQASHVTKN